MPSIKVDKAEMNSWALVRPTVQPGNSSRIATRAGNVIARWRILPVRTINQPLVAAF
jgi:hypothetical protein